MAPGHAAVDEEHDEQVAEVSPGVGVHDQHGLLQPRPCQRLLRDGGSELAVRGGAGQMHVHLVLGNLHQGVTLPGRREEHVLAVQVVHEVEGCGGPAMLSRLGVGWVRRVVVPVRFVGTVAGGMMAPIGRLASAVAAAAVDVAGAAAGGGTAAVPLCFGDVVPVQTIVSTLKGRWQSAGSELHVQKHHLKRVHDS